MIRGDFGSYLDDYLSLTEFQPVGFYIIGPLKRFVYLISNGEWGLENFCSTVVTRTTYTAAKLQLLCLIVFSGHS